MRPLGWDEYGGSCIVNIFLKSTFLHVIWRIYQKRPEHYLNWYISALTNSFFCIKGRLESLKDNFFMEWLSWVYYNKFLIWPDWLVKTCSEYARKPLSNMMKKLCSRLPRWFQTHVYQPIGSAESERLSESLFRVSKETIKERNNRFSQSCFIDSKQRFNKQRFNYSAVPYHSPLPVCVLVTRTTM